MSPRSQILAPVILRIGLALLFLWFGFSEVTQPSAWLAWVPSWATSLSGLNVTAVVLLNGWLEIIGGLFLAFGIWTRIVALLLALHLFVIVIDVGLTSVGVRDFALAMATFSLSLFGKDLYSLV